MRKYQIIPPTTIFQKIFWWFERLSMCQKELGGYTCRHGVHTGQHGGFVRECDGTPVNRDGSAL